MLCKIARCLECLADHSHFEPKSENDSITLHECCVSVRGTESRKEEKKTWITLWTVCKKKDIFTHHILLNHFVCCLDESEWLSEAPSWAETLPVWVFLSSFLHVLCGGDLVFQDSGFGFSEEGVIPHSHPYILSALTFSSWAPHWNWQRSLFYKEGWRF